MLDGEVLFNRFRLESYLGEGGMGTVYRGTDLQTGQPVAIKFIKPEAANRNPQVMERFSREADLLRALDHPNIVSVIATFPGREPCLVMEFVPGHSLRDLIESEEQISINQLLEIALDLSDALTRAHRLKIVHRDLKPENVLLAGDGTPRLTDFGLARLTDTAGKEIQPLTEEGVILGTLDYLCPEACHGEELDERADIWAFGVMLFEMLTKMRPFSRPTAAATLTAILTNPVPDIGALRPDAPAALVDLIGQMLEKKRERRITSVRQVGGKLEQITSGPDLDLPWQPVPALILDTKLHIPHTRPLLVLRPRLMEKLREGSMARLILISAPAGYGKTTLLANWIKADDLKAAWISLDEDDNDPVTFLAYLISALRSVTPAAGALSLVKLRSTQPAAINDILPLLINELSGSHGNIYLFLDDYHFIEDQVIHEVLAYLVSHFPDTVHVVLSSRSDPPLPLSRLRVRGQLAELRQKDLRFTLEEATEFLGQNVGQSLPADQVATLEFKTEGWIAGLQLAALSLAEKDDVSKFVQEFSGSHRFVLDYLADEVISQLPESLQIFLKKTAILGRFTSSLCDVVTGRSDSVSLLKDLEKTNLFLLPLDDKRQWFRYHHLFVDFLRYQLSREEEAALHARAAQWFLSHGYYREGVKHALASKDSLRAADAVVQAAPFAFSQGSLSMLLTWLNAIPEQMILHDPDLSIHKGFALFLVESDRAAVPYLLAAEQCISPQASSSTRGRLLSLKAHIAMCENRVDEAISLAREALILLDPEEQTFRDLTHNVLGQVLELKGDVQSAAEVYEQALRSRWQTGDQMGSLVVFANLVFALNETGQRQKALERCRQLIDSLMAEGAILVDAVYLPQSLLLYEANELDLALRQVERALVLLSAANFHQGMLWGNYIQARIHLARGDYPELFRTTREGQDLAAQVGSSSIQGAWLAAVEAQAYIQQNNLAAAEQWAEHMGYRPEDNPHHWQEYPYFTYVRLLLARDRSAEALALLRTMERSAEKGGRLRKLITVHLLYARYLLFQGETDRALSHVEKALALAEPGDYQRAFLDEGPGITGLLPQVRSAAPAMVDKLTAASGRLEGPLRQDSALLDPLSAREQQVLELAAEGMSNREIAEALFVTVGTVKKHLNNIFSKLGVRSRTQAAARGKELGLLK